MSQLVILPGSHAPALVTAAGERASYRFLEFFTAQIRNPHTRRAYVRAVGYFCAWLEGRVPSITAMSSVHVAAYVEELGRRQAAPSVKQQLAAIRMMFDRLATGGILPFNPASAVRGPKHVVKLGKTPVLAPDAWIGAAATMSVGDVYVQNRRLWVRLREKGGQAIALPCHHSLEIYLHDYLDRTGIADDAAGPLLRTIGRGTGQLTRTSLPSANAYAMVRRRARAAGIDTKIGIHTFRATGITAYLRNGGTLEKAAAIAHHASTRTTQLYDRRSNEVNLNEIERIGIREISRHPIASRAHRQPAHEPGEGL